jgi:hypothetical protein
MDVGKLHGKHRSAARASQKNWRQQKYPDNMCLENNLRQDARAQRLSDGSAARVIQKNWRQQKYPDNMCLENNLRQDAQDGSSKANAFPLAGAPVSFSPSGTSPPIVETSTKRLSGSSSAKAFRRKESLEEEEEARLGSSLSRQLLFSTLASKEVEREHRASEPSHDKALPGTREALEEARFGSSISRQLLFSNLAAMEAEKEQREHEEEKANREPMLVGELREMLEKRKQAGKRKPLKPSHVPRSSTSFGNSSANLEPSHDEANAPSSAGARMQPSRIPRSSISFANSCVNLQPSLDEVAYEDVDEYGDEVLEMSFVPSFKRRGSELSMISERSEQRSSLASSYGRSSCGSDGIPNRRSSIGQQAPTFYIRSPDSSSLTRIYPEGGADIPVLVPGFGTERISAGSYSQKRNSKKKKG